jgi:class 3 adenylate cyclase
MGELVLVTGLFVTPDETSPSVAAIVAQIDPVLPGYRHQTSPEGMVTIVFTDIERSTELMERLGEEAWLETMLAHNKLVRGVVADCGGDVVKAQGDGFMLAFASASAALSCAVELQRAVGRFNAGNPARSLRVRVGVHTGNIFRLDDDFLGKAVVLAARITGHARGGEVLVSAESKEYTERLGRWHYGAPTSLSLKGITDAQRVYLLDWRAA